MVKRRVSWFRKIYFPGLISLVCLPLFCVTKIIYPRYFEKLTIIRVAWLDDKEFNSGRFKIARSHLPKKIEEDSLGADKNHNDIIFTRLRERAIHYELSKDTLTAYHVMFTNKSKYEDVVEVLDILQTNGGKSVNYTWLNNKIEVFKIKPLLMAANAAGVLDHDELVITCGTHSEGEYMPFFSMENFRNLFSSSKEFVVRFWISLVLLALMLISAVVAKRKYANNLP